MTPGVRNPRIKNGFSDTLWSLRTVSLSGQLAPRPSDPRCPVDSESSMAMSTAPAGIRPERRHFSRNPKWGPSDFGCKKSGDGHGLRRPTFVLRPSRHALRAAPGLPQGLDAVSHGLAFRFRRRSRAALRRNARSYGYAGVVALRSPLMLPRFPVLLRRQVIVCQRKSIRCFRQRLRPKKTESQIQREQFDSQSIKGTPES